MNAPANPRDRTVLRATIGLVGLVALLVRLVPVLATGALRGVQGYDDGVHLAIAQRLIAGIVPYRDEIFLHPPGMRREKKHSIAQARRLSNIMRHKDDRLVTSLPDPLDVAV